MSKITFGDKTYRCLDGWYQECGNQLVKVNHVGPEVLDEIERLQAENDEYRKWYDGEGVESPETLLAKSRADCVKLQAALDEANTRFHEMNTPTGREIELRQEVRRLREELDEAMAADNERLQAIVDRLPKTKDGVSVIPYVSVVWANPMYFGHVIPKHVNDDGAIWLCGNGGPPVSQCYSTPEAAEAARTEVGE